jgi:hypothetical protein
VADLGKKVGKVAQKAGFADPQVESFRGRSELNDLQVESFRGRSDLDYAAWHAEYEAG